VQAVGSIGDNEQAEIDAESTVDERAQKGGTDLPILRRRLHEAEEHLFPRDRHADGGDHLILGERFAVEDQRDQVVLHQPPLGQFPQLPCGCPLESSQYRRRTQAERLRWADYGRRAGTDH